MFGDLRRYEDTARTDVSWLGDAPRHWRLLPGSGALRLVSARNHDLREDVVLSLSYGRVVVKPAEKLRGLVPSSFETYQLLTPGNIVVRPTDLQNDQTSVRVGLVRDRGMITSAYLGFAARTGVLPGFIYSYLTALDAMKVFYGMGSGLRQNLEWSDFKRLPVLMPPVDEQAPIVKYLAHAHHRIDRAIAAKRKLIALLEEQKQAIINQAVTRGLDPTAPLQDSGVAALGHIPAAWSHTTVGRLQLLVTSGSRGWSEHYSDTGPLFIQSGNLGRDLSLNFSRSQRVDLPPAAEGLRTAVREDDVLVCITGALTGNVVHVRGPLGEPAYVNQHVALIRLRPEVVHARFVAYLMYSECGQRQVGAAEYGGTKQGLGLADVKGVAIPLPSLAEQLEVIAHIDCATGAVGAAIDRGRREIALLHEFRTRLTSDVVTGQVDIRHIAATLPDVDPDEYAADVSDTEDGLLDEAAEFLEDVEA